MKSNNWNVTRMEYANNMTLGKRYSFAKPLMVIAIVIILLIVGKVITGHALEEKEGSVARFAACQNVLSIIATSHVPAGSNPHPACVPHTTGIPHTTGKGSTKQDKATSKDSTQVVTPASDTPVTVEVTPSPVVTVEVPTESTPPTIEPSQGNPGNDKSVGHAGEKCDKGMCENNPPIDGEHGKSNND